MPPLRGLAVGEAGRRKRYPLGERGDKERSDRERSDGNAIRSESGATKSGATKSGATESGATESGATESGATKSGATKSGATESGATLVALILLFMKNAYTIRLFVVIAWLLFTLLVAAYSILKSNPSATELWFLPTSVARLLDVFADGRTFVMTFAVAIVPALLLAPRRWRQSRHAILVTILVALLAMECWQTQIPSRSFHWADVAYTLLGVVVAEAIALGNRG